MRRTTSGFTLLELVVVITILGIMTAVAWVRVGPAYTRARVRGAANLVATDFQQAQMLAVRLREPIVVHFDPGNMRYQIRDRAADTVFVTRVFGGGTDYPIDTFSASPGQIQFFPNGIASADGTVTVGAGGYQRRTTVTRAGQIRIGNAP